MMTLITILLTTVTFSQFTMQEGLSQNAVFSITQDQDRNMWFATYEGINRFDGYNFTVYYPLRDPDFTQVEGADPLIYADSKGRIWAYDGGLSRYEPVKDSFSPINDGPRGPITSFLEISANRMMIAVDGKIVVRNLDDGSLIEDITLYVRGGASVMDKKYGILAVGTFSGDIVLFKEESLELITMKSVCPGSRILGILVSSENEIWITAQGGKVIRYKIDDGSFCDYSKTSEFRPTSSGLAADRFNRPIVYANSGIYVYDDKADGFVLYFSTLDHPIALKSIFRDAEGDIWLGSYYKGVCYCRTDDDNYFEMIPLGLSSGDLQICSIAESPEGKLWICTLDKGTWVYDPSTGQIERQNINPDPSDNGRAKCILFSSDGRRIWFGLGGGLSEYDRKTGKHVVYSNGDYPRAVYSIIPAGEHELWLGTLSGVYVFDTVTKSVRKIETSNNLFIYKLYEDDRGRLWAASESGLFRSEITRVGVTDCGVFEKESSAMDVHDIIQNNNNLIVVARNGLYIKNVDGEWNHYDKNSGLSSNFMNGVEADNSGILWIGTEYGLNRFNPYTGDASRYFKTNGFGIDYYTKNAHCSALDGSIYFGGIGGLARINPVFFNRIRESSNPRITDFIVNGGYRSMKNSDLSDKDNTISFRFSVTNYSSHQKNLFCYRLYGVDDDWKTTENPFSDTYASLRPGKYKFELKSYNIGGKESSGMAMYSFVIHPPWWASVAAIVIYLILGIMLLGVVIWRIYLINKKRTQAEIDRITEFSQAGVDRLTVLHYTKDPVSQEDAEFILKAVRLMESKISDETYSVVQLADDLCMSRSNLYLKIKKLTGDSALQFVHRIRFERACELLKGTDMSVADIAQETGFGSAAYFCTCFKREKKTTPNKWR